MSSLTRWMDRTFYSGYSDNWDDKLLRSTILKHISSSSEVLEFGAGRGKLAEMNLQGFAQRICGVDVDSAVLENPYLDDAQVIQDDGLIPYEANTFDLVFADNVMEHIPDTDAAFAEINRVLKPEGLLIAKTPNEFHYMPLVAKLTPTWFHRKYNRLRGRASEDTFPTLYQCNSKATVKHFARKQGFNVVDIALVEGRPEYLRIFAPLYICGLIYERLVNSHRVFENIRCVLCFTLVKPAATKVSESN